MTSEDKTARLRERLGSARDKDEKVKILMESTDLSANQAHALLDRHSGDHERIVKEAVNFKAEG